MNDMDEARAVVLFSGGLDSSTLCAIAKSEGQTVFALSCYYSQRHRIELDAPRAFGVSCYSASIMLCV